MRKQTPDAIYANVLTPATEHTQNIPPHRLQNWLFGSTCSTTIASIFRLYFSNHDDEPKTNRTQNHHQHHRHRHHFIIIIIIIIVQYHRRDTHSHTSPLCCAFSYVSVHAIELICMQSSIFRIKVSGADTFIVRPLAQKWQSVKFSSILWPDTMNRHYEYLYVY